MQEFLKNILTQDKVPYIKQRSSVRLNIALDLRILLWAFMRRVYQPITPDGRGRETDQSGENVQLPLREGL